MSDAFQAHILCLFPLVFSFSPPFFFSFFFQQKCWAENFTEAFQEHSRNSVYVRRVVVHAYVYPCQNLYTELICIVRIFVIFSASLVLLYLHWVKT